MHFTILEEKFIGRTVYPGRLTAVSPREASIISETALPRLCNLRLEFQAVPGANPRGEIYAKVVGQSDGCGQALIRYTSISPELKIWLRQTAEPLATETDKSGLSQT
jgi:hypothetical protein